MTDVLAREHGERWRDLIRANGVAWLRIADERPRPDDDLYGGRLADAAAAALIVHGARDPRTEPGELDALRAALGRVWRGSQFFPEGGHSPHSERATAAVTEVAQRSSPAAFLGELAVLQARGVMTALEFDRVSRDFATPDGAQYRALDDISLCRPRRRLRRHRRPERLRQVDAAQHRRRAADAVVRPRPRGRRRRSAGLNRRATYMFQQDALLPWKNGPRQRRARTDARRASRAPRRTRGRTSGSARVGLAAFGDALSVAVERRHAQARGDGAELDHRSRAAADGRAVQRARRSHAAADGNRAAGAVGRRADARSSASPDRKTVVFVTHDLEEAIALADEVIVLSAGPASRVVARHPVTLERPRDLMELRTVAGVHRPVSRALGRAARGSGQEPAHAEPTRG